MKLHIDFRKELKGVNVIDSEEKRITVLKWISVENV